MKSWQVSDAVAYNLSKSVPDPGPLNSAKYTAEYPSLF